MSCSVNVWPKWLYLYRRHSATPPFIHDLVYGRAFQYYDNKADKIVVFDNFADALNSFLECYGESE